ncbi:MAG: Sapep family Mn(2+)-dependent dipeptidase [Bacilli bacterium]|nr:Sapep family Mn(2+)-dependent dipeptidase [Bacilli bacterium]
MKKTEYEKLTSKYEKELFKSLTEFVAINSAYDETTKDEKNPFGKGVSDALNYITNLAKKDGFEVTNYDNMVVEILYGEGKKNLAIMAHADVVPAGTGWENDPFKVTEKKGVLFGRGVADDKGPLLATYYAMKALRDNKLLNGYQIRFIVGGNEESGSLCLEHYFKDLKKPAPTLGFSPDSDFPLIFAEKGIINFETSLKLDIPGLISIEGGFASNAVIEKCEVKFELNLDFLNYIGSHFKKGEAAVSTADDITTVTFIGKAAHGASPELGVNAGLIALDTLAKFTKNPDLQRIVKMYSPLDGSGYNCGGKSKDMGRNSSNVGIISYKDKTLTMVTNFRYVDTCDRKVLIDTFKEVNKPFKTKILGEAPLLYFPKDSELVSTLLKAYQDETGDLKSQPLAIGGGTYAKETSNTVAFGMQFPGWESNMHSPGESMKKEDMLKGMAVFARAIMYLGEILKK